jgi:hypothetical protein
MPLSLPLPPQSRGVMVAPICLPWELRHPVLVRVDDWRSKAPPPARVVLVADSNSLPAALGLPRMISCTAYERLPLHLFLWYKP